MRKIFSKDIGSTRYFLRIFSAGSAYKLELAQYMELQAFGDSDKHTGYNF